ncbi:MAG: prenyltransferase/squalene oxidase repeat-containing protein [Planctomycetaceae bacterium]
MMKTRILIVVMSCVLTNSAWAQEASVAEMREKAIRFLKLTQNADGSWTRPDLVGVTGLVTASLLRSGVSADDPLVAGGLKNLMAHQQPTGGFHAADSLHRNYETCVAVFALTEANTDGRYRVDINKAEQFLKGLQWDKGEGIESSDPAWGGGGYGSHQRPDMSNTQYLVEALKQAGVKEDDEAMKNILVFVSRTQNLESAANDTKFAGLINDGGFYYTPAAGGDSKAGTTDNGGLRSYGSMTYAGLKSLIYAGLDRDDPRVRAATDWIRRNYTLAENPGMGQQGLYYYFHTFGKTMEVIGEDPFVDADGNKHDWKAELRTRLAQLQQPNGSWMNPADRWFEGDPNLVTAYCLMALSHCE